MKGYGRVIALALAGALLAAGCAKLVKNPGATEPPRPVESGQGTPTQGGASQPAQDLTSDKLFPATDKEFAYSLEEGGKVVALKEYLLRDGSRVAGVQEGTLYLTWHLTSEGVFRKDPKNPQVLLRYLPPRLKDGEAWQQESGDARVLFRLKRDKEGCYPRHDEGALDCWQLTVVNRSEQLTLWFLEGHGPVRAENQSWVKSANNYRKERTEVKDVTLDPARREGWLKAADAANLTNLPNVSPLSEEEFTQIVNQMRKEAQPRSSEAHYDLDGDGTEELVIGTLNAWARDPIAFFRQDNTPLGRFDPPEKELRRVTPITFDGYKQTFFLVEEGGEGQPNRIGIWGYYKPENQPGSMVVGWGWMNKIPTIRGTRVTTKPSGEVTVVWDLGDPAQHTLTTVYRFTGFQKYIAFGPEAVEKVSSTIAPTRGELVYPTEPADLLKAAFQALWLGQTEEVSRYFASPTAAAAFMQGQQINNPEGGIGEVQTGKLAPSKEDPWGMAITPSPLGADSTTEFRAVTGGYEWSAAEWGQVKFTKDAAGRWVIEKVIISGSRLSAG